MLLTPLHFCVDLRAGQNGRFSNRKSGRSGRTCMELSVQFMSESQGICYPQSAKNLSSVQKPEYLKGGVAYIYIYL